MNISIIKIGGFVLDDPALYPAFLQQFAAISSPKILIHGGGRRASSLTRQLGLEPAMIDGRRITDDATLEIVTMVYGGLINKNITAKLQALGCNTIGLTGVDGDLIRAHKRKHPSIDFGWVGEPDKVHSDMLEMLLKNGYIPVIAPLTHDGSGQLLNTNADTIAAAIATTLSESHQVSLVYCFEHKGLLKNIDQAEDVIPFVRYSDVQSLIDQGIITGGMIPKVHNIQLSLQQGVSKVILCAADEILQVIENPESHTGTIFTL